MRGLLCTAAACALMLITAAPRAWQTPRADAPSPWMIAERLDATRVVVHLSNDEVRDMTDSAFVALGPSAGSAVARFLEARLPEAGWLTSVLKRPAPDGVWTVDAGRRGRFRAVADAGVAIKAGCGVYPGIRLTVENEDAFTGVREKYFPVRRGEPERTLRTTTVGPVAAVMMGEQRRDIERQLAGPAAKAAADVPVAESARALWATRVSRLERGDAKVRLDVQAFRLTPDGDPRWFVRARFDVDGHPAALVSAWFRVGSAVTLESVDTGGSGHVRYRADVMPDLNWAGQILNVTDVDGDGHAELLMLGQGYESYAFELTPYLAGPRDARPVIARFVAGC